MHGDHSAKDRARRQCARRLWHAIWHGHLGDVELTPEEIADGTFDSTRRLYVLMQACLLRDLGVETDRIEELIQLHYLSWPVP